MKRLDLLLLEKGLASTRTKAQELISSGKVLVNGKAIFRSGEKFCPASVEIVLTAAEYPYVSRGGLKLEEALRSFSLSVKGLRALDVGQSTGGFTDCLLRFGASEVVGVDVGSGQLSPALRADARVKFFEKTDIRSLNPKSAGAPFPFFTVDLSFLSLSHVAELLPGFLEYSANGVVLVKPQFEVGPENVGSGGIVRDAALQRDTEIGRAHV